MVLVGLAIIWAAVLVPPALRRWLERRAADSISEFDRQLAVLERSRPGTARRAPDRFRTRGPAPSPAVLPGAGVASLSAHRARINGGLRPQASGSALASYRRHASSRRRALRRRRDILVGLLATSALTLVLGVLPVLRTMLLVHVVVDVLLVAYVALLIRQRTLAAEREMKVRFLPGPRAMEPALLRRSVN